MILVVDMYLMTLPVSTRPRGRERERERERERDQNPSEAQSKDFLLVLPLEYRTVARREQPAALDDAGFIGGGIGKLAVVTYKAYLEALVSRRCMPVRHRETLALSFRSSNPLVDTWRNYDGLPFPQALIIA